MKTKPQTRHRHAELCSVSRPVSSLLAILPPFSSGYDLVRWPELGENNRWGAASVRQTHTYAVMSQALYCGCGPDSLIREECCPWHPEFSTEITHSSSLFPALGSSSQPEQTRRGNPLSPSPSPPSSHCARPLLRHMLLHILFITFSFSPITQGQLMQAIGALYFLPLCWILLVWFWSDTRT